MPFNSDHQEFATARIDASFGEAAPRHAMTIDRSTRAAIRIRAENPGFAYGYPKEGFPRWLDNVAILTDANDVDNAKLFLNFIINPKNAAMILTYMG